MATILENRSLPSEGGVHRNGIGFAARSYPYYERVSAVFTSARWETYEALLAERGANCLPRLAYGNSVLEIVGDAWIDAPNASYVLNLRVSYDTYSALTDDRGDGSVPRLAYDGTFLEICMPSRTHEWVNRLVALFVEALTLAWEMPAEDFGSETHHRPGTSTGFEPDSCFSLAPNGNDAATPLLAIEMEISNSAVGKLPLYAAWGYPEVWRVGFDANEQVTVVIHLLEKGAYKRQSDSAMFAPLTETVLRDFLQARIDGENKADWIGRIQAWARATRPDAGERA